MFLKTKTGRMLEIPTPEEDAAINAGIAADPDTFELTDEWFAKAKRGRPAMPPQQRKKRVNVMIAPDIADRISKIGNVSALVNQLLRAHFSK
jgi:hypothetical protein